MTSPVALNISAAVHHFNGPAVHMVTIAATRRLYMSPVWASPSEWMHLMLHLRKMWMTGWFWNVFFIIPACGPEVPNSCQARKMISILSEGCVPPRSYLPRPRLCVWQNLWMTESWQCTKPVQKPRTDLPKGKHSFFQFRTMFAPGPEFFWRKETEVKRTQRLCCCFVLMFTLGVRRPEMLLHNLTTETIPTE